VKSILAIPRRAHCRPGAPHDVDPRHRPGGLHRHAVFGQEPVLPIAGQFDDQPAQVGDEIIGMDMQPADAGALLRVEGVAAQRKSGGEGLATGKAFRVEGISGSEDQFFSSTSPGTSNRIANAVSTGRCGFGIA
jgi:hypothetical protein